MTPELPRVAVAGDYMTISIAEFRTRVDALLYEEQEKVLPDNALIGVLCEAVRLSRETARAQRALSKERREALELVIHDIGDLRGYGHRFERAIAILRAMLAERVEG